MRSWHPIAPDRLDRSRLLGEHVEIHSMASVLSRLRREERTGYSRHPEVLRWKGHEGALRLRHDQVVLEMTTRGYNHKSPLGLTGPETWPEGLVSEGELLALLVRKQGGVHGRTP
jgi:hypothetical protein